VRNNAASNLLARIQVSVIGGSIMRTEKRPRPLKSGEAGTANFRGTRDLVPEAQSKIHCGVMVPIERCSVRRPERHVTQETNRPRIS